MWDPQVMDPPGPGQLEPPEDGIVVLRVSKIPNIMLGIRSRWALLEREDWPVEVAPPTSGLQAFPKYEINYSMQPVIHRCLLGRARVFASLWQQQHCLDVRKSEVLSWLCW